jgi:hypothetical protein
MVRGFLYEPGLVCTSCGGRNVQVMPDWPPVPGAAYTID